MNLLAGINASIADMKDETKAVKTGARICKHLISKEREEIKVELKVSKEISTMRVGIEITKELALVKKQWTKQNLQKRQM
jgi:Trp operon repressor